MMAGTLPSAPGAPKLITQSSKQIYFTWQEPFDNGGSKIVEYEILITLVSDLSEVSKTIINALVFDFVPAEGMLPGYEYKFKIRAKNYFTHYYSVGDSSPWSADSTFYSSDLPLTVSEVTFTDRTKTDATINWTLHTTELAKGYSTIEPYYLLWVDNC
jgi:hypothetical protein